MQRKSDERSVRGANGFEARLYQRLNSQMWWYRAIGPSGEPVRRSTGETDLERARQAVLLAVTEMKVRADMGLAPRAVTFAKVAERTIKELEVDIAADKAADTCRHYISTIENYLIPSLGNYHISNIDRPELAALDTFRLEKLGRRPKHSTVQNHHAALQRVFHTAVRHGWMKSHQVPNLENTGDDGETRATFTKDEFDRLSDYMEGWVTQGRNGLPRQIRLALRELVLVVAATGMRPGTETRGLTWDDIEEDYKHGDGETYVRLWVTEGKTEKREIIAPSSVLTSFARLRGSNPNLKSDWPIFATWDGRYPDFCHPFKRLLRSAGLLVDRHGDTRTLYSLRHFYATRQRERGVSFEVLSSQMGTSIAMLERHYIHVTASSDARALAGRDDPQVALVSNFIQQQRALWKQEQERHDLALSTTPGNATPLRLGADGTLRIGDVGTAPATGGGLRVRPATGREPAQNRARREKTK